MHSIIFIDDDSEIIQSTRRLLFSSRRDWKVTYANSAHEALEIMKNQKFEVMVSDIRMPDMSGIELLGLVRKNYPQTVRIALSGHSDREASLQASGLVHQYLAKPCSIETIVDAIQLALSSGDFGLSERIKELLGQLKTIPSQPAIYFQIIEELKNPDTSAMRIGKIISRDPSMAAKLIQLVNSAFFGLPQNVIDPAQAVVLLGVETIRDLVLGVGVFSQFDQSKLAQFSLDNLWNHSQRTSGLAKLIAIKLGGDKNQISNALVAGLLHDIGRLIIADNLPTQYLEILHNSRDRNLSFTDCEQGIIGANHAQIAAYLFGLWGLSQPIVNSVAGHHHPTSVGQDYPIELISVHAANVIDYQVHPDQSLIGPSPEFDQMLISLFNLTDQVESWRQLALST